MFGFLKNTSQPYRPRKPEALAIYECRCCKEVFFRDPDDYPISGIDGYSTLLGHKAWTQVFHGCKPFQQGIAELVGMKKVDQ